MNLGKNQGGSPYLLCKRLSQAPKFSVGQFAGSFHRGFNRCMSRPFVDVFPTASGEDFANQAGASAWFRHKKNPIESSESHQWIDISL